MQAKIGRVQFLAAAILALSSAVGLAGSGVSENYTGLSAGILVPDSDRSARVGVALDGYFGYPLNEFAAVEVGAFGATSRHNSGVDDSYLGGRVGGNWGTRAPGSPFFLLGGGGVHQSTALGDELSPFVDLGVGFYPSFEHPRNRMRVELRWTLVHAGSLSNESMLQDVRILAGMMVGGSPAPLRVAATIEPPAPVASATPVAVPDTKPAPMKKGRTLIASLSLSLPDAPQVPESPKETRIFTLHFNLGAGVLTREELRRAKPIAEWLNQNPYNLIEVSGFTDPTGYLHWNQRLSNLRANFVRKYMISLGVDPARIRAVGYGLAPPLKAIFERRKELDEHAVARRVELRVLR